MTAAVNGNGSVTIERLNMLLPNAVLLPIPGRQKRPTLPGWQHVTLAASRQPAYGKTLVEHTNTGVLLGRPSEDLVAIDVDSDEGVELFLALNPRLRNTLRSKARRGCQFWIRMDGDYPHNVAKLKDHTGKPFGEWRADGGQSVIRGVHPEGVHYQLLCDAEPIRIPFDQICWPFGLSLPWKNPPPKAEHLAGAPGVRAGLSERIRTYLARVEPAISGQDGHGVTFKVACALVWGFALDAEQAFPFLSEYNGRCQPPWSEKELRHKLDEALKVPQEKPRGHLLDEKFRRYDRRTGEGPGTEQSRGTSGDQEREQEVREIRPLRGASLVSFSKRPINEEDTLLGNRFLCRGGGLPVVGPSGAGKSSCSIQMAIEFGSGRDSFGIPNRRPLNVIIVQAEDDEGDCIEMSRIVDHLNLTTLERSLVDQNTHLEFVNDVTGLSFITVLEGFLEQRPSDLIIINPFSAYLGADIQDDKATNQFLRNWLNPQLVKHRCGCILMCHTPKLNFRGDTSNWRPAQWMYAAAGPAVLTNWARAMIVIDPTEADGVFRFIAAKRYQRIGWIGWDQFWAHSRDEGVLKWIPADSEQTACAKKRAEKGPDDLIRIIPVLDPITQDQFFIAAKEIGIGVNKARTYINALLDEGRAHAWKIKRINRKPAIGYAQRPQHEEEECS